MMKHHRRLSMNRRDEFVLCREKGVSKPGKFMVLSTLEDNSLEFSKFAYITTKKVGKAHQRNAIRRKLRAITQKYGDSLKGKRYLVVIVRWRAVDASFEELERDWVKLARKLNIIEP